MIRFPYQRFIKFTGILLSKNHKIPQIALYSKSRLGPLATCCFASPAKYFSEK